MKPAGLPKRQVIELTMLSILIALLIVAGLGSATYAGEPAVQEPIIIVSASVFEGENEMEIFSDGMVNCYSVHYVPWYKAITIKEGYIPKSDIDELLDFFQNFEDGYSEFTVDFGDKGEYHIFDFMGSVKISCTALNGTVKFRPSFDESGTATTEAIEILKRIDSIYTETPIVEIRKEINPTLISIDLETENFHTGQIITFNASCEEGGWIGKVTSYEWDFDDGSKGYGESVCHSYSSPGDYTVKMTVTTSSDAVGTKYATINVTETTFAPTPTTTTTGYDTVFAVLVLLAVGYALRRR